jgi:hypothetical protein
VIATTTGIVKVSQNIGFDKHELYQRFSTLIQSSAFEQPISLVRSYDPDGSGWNGASARIGAQSVFPVSLKKMLVGPRQVPDVNMIAVILPEGHWLELGFSREIVDGPGIDICFDGFDDNWTDGKLPDIFITDGGGQEVQITSPASFQGSGNGWLLTGFDISHLSIPFKPYALRFVGTDNGPWLYSVWARVGQ